VRKRKLPLESPHWWPLVDLLDRHSQRTGSDKLAVQDFSRALQAEDGLRSLVRRADRSSEQLAASAWKNDFRIMGWGHGGPAQARLCVFSRPLDARPPGCWFFVWLPDYKNIFGDSHANSSPSEQMQKVPKTRGAKPKHPWPQIGFKLVRRLQELGPVAGNKSTNSLAEELEEWCENKYRKAPSSSELRAFVDDVRHALYIKRKSR
jgi:hypothetical protein